MFRIDQIPILYEDADILVLNKPGGISVIPERYEEGEPSLLELLSNRGARTQTQILNHTQIQGEGLPGIQEEFSQTNGIGTKMAPPEGFPLRPVHRIDKDTSGVVLFAKTDEAFRALSLQFQERTLTKIYHALVLGRPIWTEQECDAPLWVDGDRRHRTIVHRDGKVSHTRFTVLETFRGFSLVEALPKTGRTHQIRAHLSYLGHPIVGDELYRGGKGLYLSSFKRDYKGLQPSIGGSGTEKSKGWSERVEGRRGGAPTGGRERGGTSSINQAWGTGRFDEGKSGEKPLIGRLALHALSLEFQHPRTGERLRFDAPCPKDLSVALKQLRKYGR